LAPRPLYYVWDFVQRTKHNLSRIDIGKLQAGDAAALEEYQDAFGRSCLSALLIEDKQGKMLKQIAPGETPVDFGDTVREKARALGK
jgi:hypothetical protein